LAPKLVADGMLGSLTRKLRLYGLDVLYFSDLEDAELLDKSRIEGRTLLTSDRELHRQALKKGIGCILVSAKGEVAMAAQVFGGLGISPTMEVSSARCPSCNGVVVPAETGEVLDAVPAGVLSRQKKFYRCSSCHHVYWEGSHWFRLSRFDEQVKEAMKA